MLWRGRRLLVACLLALFLIVLYHTCIHPGNSQPNRPQPAWPRALRGDANAFEIHLDGGLGSLISQTTLEIYPVQNLFELPDTSSGQPLPRIQHDFDGSSTSGAQQERLEAVREAFQHSWDGYKQFAYGKDELRPVTGGHHATFGNWAATLIDSLDTLWIIGMEEEFEEGLEVVRTIDFSSPDALPINVFEVTIRYLGGLLGAYDVSNHQYPILLDKAKEVGTMLLGSFDTYNRMPVTYWNKEYGQKASRAASIAEFGSLSLEFTRLSQLTNDMRFYDAIHRISQCMASQQAHTKIPGLFPTQVNIRDCKFSLDSEFSLGAAADSAFEYLPKMAQLLHNSMPVYRDMYLATLSPISAYLLKRPMTPNNLDILLPITYKATPPIPDIKPQMQHLACFAGGMLALGSRLFPVEAADNLTTARRLTEGCVWAYNATNTGIMPEQFYFVPCPSDPNNAACEWDPDYYKTRLAADRHHHHQPNLPAGTEAAAISLGTTAISSPTYRLRPEAIESLFVLYRITGDAYYREAAWKMFLAITKHTRTKYGYSGLKDVMVTSSSKENFTNRQETFWTAETLKYFWLIFSEPGLISLDDWVLSTEAHPFRLRSWD